MHKAKEREKMIGLIINAKRTDPETGSFTEWLADYLLDHGVTVPADDVPEALPENRRPAPPIGRCKDCAHSSPRMVMGNKTYGKVCKIDSYLVHEVNPDGYCDGFKPKEAPND